MMGPESLHKKKNRLLPSSVFIPPLQVFKKGGQFLLRLGSEDVSGTREWHLFCSVRGRVFGGLVVVLRHQQVMGNDFAYHMMFS